MFVYRNQGDRDERYPPAMFESEDEARRAERNPTQADFIRRYWEVYEAPPEYADLCEHFLIGRVE